MKLLFIVLLFTITGCATSEKHTSISDGHIEKAISDSDAIDNKSVVIEKWLSVH